MSDDKETAELRALVELPERCQMWGQDYVVTPRLIGEKIGDGKQLVCVTPIFERPNYFVARVDSAMTNVLDMFRGGREYLDAIMDAAEEEYGYHGDEEYRDEHGDETRGFPVADWGAGCSWGKPFPVAEWKPAPPLVLWHRNLSDRTRSGAKRWHLPSLHDASAALCRSHGANRIVLDGSRSGSAPLPQRSERCAACSRSAWSAWRIP